MQWMAWTLPTALFFIAIAVALTLMTLAEIYWPTTQKKGLLPFVTTRGERFFMTLLASAFIHITWLGLTDIPLYWASGLCVGGGIIVLRWG